MIAVTGYPVIYAIWLSLERYNLELPNAVKFVGFANYGAVLSSPYWWQALWVTVLITVISVARHSGARHDAGHGHAPDAVRQGHGPHGRAHPVRDRDGRRRVRLVLRMDAGPGYLSALSTMPRR